MSKRTIVKASTAEDRAYSKARGILKAMQDLFDRLEDTPSGFVDANDLGPLYEELVDAIPALSFAIKSDSLEV